MFHLLKNFRLQFEAQPENGVSHKRNGYLRFLRIYKQQKIQYLKFYKLSIESRIWRCGSENQTGTRV